MKLTFMIMMIWYDVDVYENVDARGFWYWCWEYHWDEMVLMLMMILRWDDVDDDNDIEIMLMLTVSLWWRMLCMYIGGAVTKLDVLGGINKVVKEF